jgi:hypothetical protein
MTKQLILKDLSKLVQRYTPKQGVLIQSLPQDEIFEYPKSDTTRLYRIKNYDVPIVEKTPAQAPPLPISLLMDLKKYLKDAKSKEIINQYIEQTKQLQLEYKEPIRPIEEEKKKAQKTIEKENQKAIQGAPLALKAGEKALEDMDEKELALFIKRSDISVSDKKKAAKLMIKLQQKPKEKLAIEAAPKAKAEPKPAPKAKAETAPAPKKEEAKPTPKAEETEKPEIDPINLTDEQALKQLEPPVVEDERKANIRERIVEIYTFKDILSGKIKGTLPFKNEDELKEYENSFKQDKKYWSANGGNTSTITTPLNALKKLFYKRMGDEMRAEKEKEAKKAAKEAVKKAKEEEEAKAKAEAEAKEQAEAEAQAKAEKTVVKKKKATPKSK